MAYRDKTQGFAFVYVDIKKLLEENKNKRGAISPEVSSEPSTVINFNRDSQSPNAVKAEIAKRMGEWDAKKVSDASQLSPAEKHAAVEQIKHNLDRLQSLHHRLHAVLADVNKAAKKDKKKS